MKLFAKSFRKRRLLKKGSTQKLLLFLLISDFQTAFKPVSCQAGLTGMIFSSFWASGVLGRVTVSTPLLNEASMPAISTPSGIGIDRMNEPKRRSE